MNVRYLVSFSLVGFCLAVVFTGCSSPEPGGDAPEAAAVESDAPAEPSAAGSADPPEVVAEKFIEAGNAGDQEAFLGLLTEKARAGFEEDGGLGEDSGFESYTIGETTIDGETATVAVDAVDDGESLDVSLRMRQEESAWRVFAMDIDLGDGLVMKMDFEQIGGMLDSMAASMGEAMGEAMGEMAQAMSEGFSAAFETSPEELAAERAKYEAVRTVSAEEYRGSWRNETDYRGQSAKDALAQLAEELNLPIDTEGHGEALAAEVTAEVAGLSKLEAIERIAADAGLYPVFPDPVSEANAMLESMATALAETVGTLLEESGISIEGGVDAETEDGGADAVQGALTFMAGERPYPAVFPGPFVVEITGVEEEAPNTRGSLSLVVRTYGLDPALTTLLETDTAGLVFESIADAKGRPLNDVDVRYLSGGTSDGIRYADAYSVELLNLIREVEEIAVVSGVQRLRRPTGVVELAFPDASEGATAEAEGFTATIESAGDYTQIDVKTPEGVDVQNVVAMAQASDAEGSPISASFVSTMPWQEGELDVSLNLDAAPGSLALKLVSALEIHEYAFEFSGIPLERFTEQPEKVEQLSFEGEAPVTVEFLEITDPDTSFGKVRVRATNHSNKDAEHVSLNLIYLDGSGAELESFPAGLNVVQEFRDGEFVTKPSVPKGETVEVETTAFNMPEGTKEVRIEVNAAEFSDGSDWRAE